MNQTVQQKIRNSAKVTFLGTIANGILQVIGLTVLSRLLSPADYGVFAISLSLNAVTLQFAASATERALLLLESSNDAERAFAPVISIVAIAALLPLIGYTLADSFGYKGLSFSITCMLILTQAVNALAIVPRAMLRRDIRFGRIVAGEFSGQLLGQLCLSMLLAYLGFGAISLAWGQLLSVVIITAVIISSQPLSLFCWRMEGFGRIWKLFRSIGSVSGLEMMAVQSPPFLLGSVFGVVTTGLFNRANAIIGLPLQLATNSISRVLISGFSLSIRDQSALRNTFLGQLRLIAVICFPVAVGIAASSASFTAVVLGSKWLAVGPMVVPVALFSAFSLMCVLTGTLADAAHRFREKMAIQLIDNVAAVLAIVGFGQIGASAALYGLAATALARFGLSLWLSRTIIESSWQAIGRALMPSIASAGVVFVSASTVGWLLTGYTMFVVLTGQVAICGVSLVITLLVVDRDMVFQVLGTQRGRPASQ
ncbi:oligosaccharide flippase family protein [Sphingomonas sp. Leaf230]|uniref:oligosaccharide flippase family protein n=1 Tax=Sphingomonas sp. Leaf230 TaxID=1735694 RepID=UPI000B2B403C|nr:oligosaccharide flippase family protein [Sphingomonas sp. Leaf230]